MARKVQNLAQVFRSAVMFAHSVGSSDDRRRYIGHLVFADFQFGRIGLSERSDLVMLLKLRLSSCSFLRVFQPPGLLVLRPLFLGHVTLPHAAMDRHTVTVLLTMSPLNFRTSASVKILAQLQLVRTTARLP
ncbi:hypothetical protein M422DRAFT_30710 [Sphaerobolus stellatus SS14]|uniref:Uncharacterized protein n=1 Tax=Sphaerobolus stellatus (strain SS14) TaxID=990650 RepID=A0A0C9VY20_SPHS4|nr:hypothetical protein M422DRAFT_30710 [Sphaerobolus stellatus SS14]